MTATIPLQLVRTHRDVPESELRSHEEFVPEAAIGVSKYVAQIPENGSLKALLVNKGTDVLVVAFHGATNRAKKEIPRFEWLRTLREEPVSSLYFSDPLLEKDVSLELAWYTGTRSFDLHAKIADWSVRAAEATGASRIIFLGSSGGGFAALQVSALVERSLALPFSPQTALARYRVGGAGLGAQRKYLKVVMPELVPDVSLENLSGDVDWSEPLGGRLSALTRYREPRDNFVYYVQNTNDVPHLEQHYWPFREVIECGANKGRARFDLYEGPVGHNPPSTNEFYRTLREAIEWHKLVI